MSEQDDEDDAASLSHARKTQEKFALVQAEPHKIPEKDLALFNANLQLKNQQRIIDKQAKQIKADDEEIKALICANPHNEVNIRELEKRLKAKENEISRLHRIIELDEQIEQALKATELVGLLQQTVWIAEKAERDDCEDTTLELARQAIERSKHG